MGKAELIAFLIDSVRRVQEETGADQEVVTASTSPLDDLQGFDSPRGLELSCEIDAGLDVDVPIDVNLFIDENGKTRTISEIADYLLTLSQEGNDAS